MSRVNIVSRFSDQLPGTTLSVPFGKQQTHQHSEASGKMKSCIVCFWKRRLTDGKDVWLMNTYVQQQVQSSAKRQSIRTAYWKLVDVNVVVSKWTGSPHYVISSCRWSNEHCFHQALLLFHLISRVFTFLCNLVHLNLGTVSGKQVGVERNVCGWALCTANKDKNHFKQDMPIDTYLSSHHHVKRII